MKFFRKNQRVILSVLAGLMALLMILPMLANVVGIVAATKTDDLKNEINRLKNESSSLSSQKAELDRQLKAVRNDKNKAVNQKKYIEQQMDVITSEIEMSNRLISEYDRLIEEKELELSDAQMAEEEYFDLFCERVRAMEENRNVSYWSILFNAADFSDLLDRVAFVSEVMEYDNAVMDKLAQTRQDVADAKGELEESRTAQEEVRAAQQLHRTELADKEAQATALVNEIAAKEDELEEAEAELKAAAALIDKQVAAKQAEYDKLIAAGKITIDPGSGFQWPLSGYTTLSSLFGNRIHPVTGKYGNHSGIDIPAPKNTKICAARGGVVTTSVYGSGAYWSYGNYVVINHGDGTSTLYAHMNSRAVKEGAVVKQGQVIGYVGTTGRSTGYHLHFEIRKNNVRVDPVNYFPNMTLYARSNGVVKKIEH